MIDVQGLNYTWPGGEPTLHDLSFSVPSGEVFGFLGPSGSGKSTTQKILTGLLHGYQGSVKVLDRDIKAWGRDLYTKIGVGFERPAVHSRLTARENLAYFASLYGVPCDDPRELLEQVGLADDADRRVEGFSKGMKVRLDLCRALQHRPQLLFLDEPTSGLDPGLARKVRDLLLAKRAAGQTMFLTTHDMTEATELCDTVGFLVDGRLVTVGRTEALMRAHGKRQVRVEHDGTTTHFELDGLADNEAFLDLLRQGITAMHSEEATLEQVFLAETGQRLVD